MRKYSIYLMLLIATASTLFTGCKDDEVVSDSEYSSERLFMPMFRVEQNTNNSEDRYASTIASESQPSSSSFVNDVQLYWYGVTGASGYRLKSKIQGTDWELNCVLDTILGPEVLEFLHEDLQYSTGYSYAIQALSPKGEEYNSKWYGYGDGSHQKDYVTITTGLRYDVPNVFWTSDITKETVRVYFNTTAESGYESTYSSFLEAGGVVVDGEWVFDEIRIVPTADNPDLATLSHTMTDEDFERGYVDFEGLTSNGAYIVQGQNNDVVRYYDRQYNKIMMRMQGDPGDPITIPATVADNDTLLNMYYSTAQAARIDTVLYNYMSDNTITEGQVFYLEGGKTYYFGASVSLTKGFTLETNPDDLAAGKGRATVLLGVGHTTEAKTDANEVTLMLGRNAQSSDENGVMLTFQDIKFNEINFHPEYYYSYLDKNATDGNSALAVSANYFLNMYSQGLSFSLTELSITNCTFSGLGRGFIRFQGPNREIIEHLTVEGCVFYDCGPYDNNGRGYAWFAGPGNNKNSNFYENLTIRNCTWIDSPKHALVSENGNLAWPTGTTWNIVVENNTFINLSPRSSSSGHGLMFETRYAPAGSKITCRKNLFVMVRNGDSDNRNLYMRGMRIQNGAVYYDIADNYATTVPDWTTSNLSDGLWTNYPFSHTTNGAGYQSGIMNDGGMEETRIKFGDNVNGNEDDAVGYQLTPEELFQDPAPNASNGYKDMHRHNNDGFYYNNNSTVTNHPIYTKEIGDPRWRTGAAWQ
ncbi:MAG: hypothetical protein Q4D56_11915 [Bacteroides sp.]|nr:hypothetical protein [Bacteroides sp.]